VNPADDLPVELLSRIEDAGLNASAAPQQRWLDGWILRFSPGKAQRARCINAVAEGVRPVADKLARCEMLYRAAGLPLLWRITPFTRPPDLDAMLAQRGMQRFDETWVMVCRQLPAVSACDEAASIAAHLDAVTPEAYAHIVGEFRNTEPSGRAAHAERLRHSPVPYHALVLRDAQGQVLAGGQFAIEGDLVGLYDVFTVPAMRGRGLSRSLCVAMLQQAHHLGARTAYLQVDAVNAAARKVYHRLGFVDAYRYHYRALPPPAG
jgi:GNAT superfamily N-acetyltransferase